MSLSAVAVSEQDGQVIGFMHLTHHGMRRDAFSSLLHTTTPGECYIEMLAVSEVARGQGIGTRLLDWGEEQARARGATKLTLGVVKGNPAQRLYERRGFVPVHVNACESIGSAAVICCLFGMPHGQCGGIEMEKALSNDV